MNSIIKRCLLAALVLPALAATGQPAGDSIPAKPNELNINLQFMGRGESRYGGMMPEDDAVFGDEEETEQKTPTSNFLLGRTRLQIDYKRDWLEARVTPQHSGVWGQAGKGAFNLYETWVKMKAPFGLFAQVGRIALDYDDERIIGSDDWAMASSSHDVLRLGYEGHGHKAHVMLAYNQNADVLSTGGNAYYNGGQPYKTMQNLWYHYDFPKFPLGVSVLFMNIGMQNDPDAEERTWYQHLLGGYASFQPKRWKAEASYYHQFGHNEFGMKIDAWMMSTKLNFQPANYGFTVGYDYLSGDEYFAVPPSGAIGMSQHKVIKGFSTVYGSHHQFYGAMDFFYVSTYLFGFTPSLQNAYLNVNYKPIKGLNLSASYHYLAIATKLDQIDKSLGNEFELQGSYAITRDVIISLGGSFMKGTETMKKLKRSSNNNTLRWGWITLIVNPRIFSFKW